MSDWPYSDDYTFEDVLGIVADVFFGAAETELGEELSDAEPSGGDGDYVAGVGTGEVFIPVTDKAAITEWLAETATVNAGYYSDLCCDYHIPEGDLYGSAEEKEEAIEKAEAEAEDRADAELNRRLVLVGLEPLVD